MKRTGRLLLLWVLIGCWGLLPSDGPGPGAAAVGGAAEVTLPAKVVALTFDDGPRASTTGALLDGLALREVNATFFVVGSRLPGNEPLILRMIQEGHQIGVHTYDHVSLRNLPREEIRRQVEETRAALDGITGTRGSWWLRPPYGLMDAAVQAEAGSPIVLWSVDPEDWRDSDVQRMVSSALGQVEDGSILLFHDLYPDSVQAALDTVDLLLGEGYCFLTVEQLLAYRGIQPQAGQVYRCAPAPAAGEGSRPLDRGGNA